MAGEAGLQVFIPPEDDLLRLHVLVDIDARLLLGAAPSLLASCVRGWRQREGVSSGQEIVGGGQTVEAALGPGGCFLLAREVQSGI